VVRNSSSEENVGSASTNSTPAVAAAAAADAHTAVKPSTDPAIAGDLLSSGLPLPVRRMPQTSSRHPALSCAH